LDFIHYGDRSLCRNLPVQRSAAGR
jgi:hypothetical protein